MAFACRMLCCLNLTIVLRLFMRYNSTEDTCKEGIRSLQLFSPSLLEPYIALLFLGKVAGIMRMSILNPRNFDRFSDWTWNFMFVILEFYVCKMLSLSTFCGKCTNFKMSKTAQFWGTIGMPRMQAIKPPGFFIVSYMFRFSRDHPGIILKLGFVADPKL